MNSVVCVDASIIIWALVPFPLSDSAEDLLVRWQQEDVSLIAPALFAFEVISTLRRLVYLNELTASEGEEAFRRFLDIPVRLSHRRAIFPVAWKLAQDFNLSRAYDSSYLALAQIHQCEFWTADKRLFNTVRDRLSWVRWVGPGEVS